MKTICIICISMLCCLQSIAQCPDNFTPYTPIADLADSSFNGFKGGLYPGGNQIPSSHYTKGLQQRDSIIPRAADGHADANGQVGFLVLGFSTAAMTGRTYRDMLSTLHPDTPVKVIIGAQGGQDINAMLKSNGAYWKSVDSAITASGLSNAQVQIVWVSTGDIFTYTQAFPEQAQTGVEKYRQMLTELRKRYPSVRMVFMSDRPYAGYIGTDQPPGPKELAEPSAYYHSWTVKWVIEKQIMEVPGFKTSDIPFIDWGPTLWTNGTKGDAQGYTWDCRDAGKGGIHPSSKGRMKEAAKLYVYFSQHPYTAHLFQK